MKGALVGPEHISPIIDTVAGSPDPKEERKVVTAISPGVMPKAWIHGCPKDMVSSDDALQVHWYNEDFVILRQSKSIHFEAPFLYLIFGQEKAALFDTGATKKVETFPLQKTVEDLMRKRYGARRSEVELLVTHTHAHGDHVAADAQFAEQANTRLIGAKLDDCLPFFGFQDWPTQVAKFDLGARPLYLIPIPGHETTDIAIYDEKTGNVLSGDTVYPGRLYVTNWQAFCASLERLYDFLKDRPVRYFLGSHIEMSNQAGVDYPAGTEYQPDETPLEMDWNDFLNIREAVKKLGNEPKRDVHPKFIITPVRGGS